MLRFILCLLFLTGVISGQISQAKLYFVISDPAGSCAVKSPLQYNTLNGKLWGCDNGTWTQIGGGGGGGTPGGGDTAIQVNHPAGTFAGDATKLSRDDTFGLFSNAATIGNKNNYNVGSAAGGIPNSLVLYGDDSQAPQVGMAGIQTPAVFTRFFANGTPLVRTPAISGNEIFRETTHALDSGSASIRAITVTDDVCGTVGTFTVPTRRTFTLEDTDGSDNDLLVLNGCGKEVTISNPILGNGVAFASLPTPTNGMTLYCTDCTVTSGVDDTCKATGSGALATRINGAWKCVV